MMMSLVIIISMAFLIGEGGAARVYKIGESGGGWRIYKDREYYQRWTEDKQFFVGDSLVFEYELKWTFSYNMDDVTEVTGHLEFEFCDPTSAKARHKTGHDVVTFTKPGIHYFINSAPGKCYAGQKLRVLVLPDPDPSHAPSISIPRLSSVPSGGKVFKVGDSNEWKTKVDRTWYEDKQFQVGDSLLFQYDKELDNVVQVSGGLEMEFCDASSPLAVYETGHDVVKLDSPGSYYFISSKPGRCAAGLVLDVLVTTRDSPIQAPLHLQY